MLYTKQLDGVLMNKINDLNIFKVALNGVILVHKKQNLMAFTNSIVNNNISFLDDYQGFRNYFKDKNDYDTYIVQNGNLIKNPSNEDFEYLEENRYKVLYSKLLKELKSKGFKKEDNVVRIINIPA